MILIVDHSLWIVQNGSFLFEEQLPLSNLHWSLLCLSLLAPGTFTWTLTTCMMPPYLLSNIDGDEILSVLRTNSDQKMLSPPQLRVCRRQADLHAFQIFSGNVNLAGILGIWQPSRPRLWEHPSKVARSRCTAGICVEAGSWRYIFIEISWNWATSFPEAPRAIHTLHPPFKTSILMDDIWSVRDTVFTNASKINSIPRFRGKNLVLESLVVWNKMSADLFMIILKIATLQMFFGATVREQAYKGSKYTKISSLLLL